MKKIVYIIFLITFHFCSSGQESQTRQIDSLMELSFDLKEGPKKVVLLNQITELYRKHPRKSMKDSSRVYSMMTINLARRINDTLGLATALYDLGKYYVGVDNKPAESTKYLLESLQFFSSLKDKNGISKCYMQLGLISYILEYYEDAIKNFRLSLQTLDQPTTNFLIAIAYTEVDSFPKAQKHFGLAIENYKALKSHDRLAECYLYLGRLQLKSGDLNSALINMNKAKDYRIKEGDPIMLVRPNAFLSEVYFEYGDLEKAIDLATKSFEVETHKTDQQKDEISLIQSTKILSRAYELQKNYEKAHFFLNRYQKESNRFTNGSTKQQVADMQSMFEFKQALSLQKIRQEKDKEIAQQQIAKEKILRNSFLIGSVLLLLLLIVLFNRFNLKRRANEDLHELNQVISIEKKRSDDLLLNILPENIAEELKENGKAEARDFDLVSVLFTDFKGFTKTSEKLSAQDLVFEINACFEAFDGIMEKHGIEKIKTIGDAYMAVGGLDQPPEKSVRNTVLAALEMQSFIGKRKIELDATGKPAFEMRVGIHTGPVVAGIVGVKKFQYDIWGDTVNTASRMESTGKVEKVNISQATYEILKNNPTDVLGQQFVFENRGRINAKGKGEMEMYFVSLKN